jgi:hypothetical protein
MPNGSDMSEQEFRQLDACFTSSDDTIERYAEKIGGKYIRNDHGIPGRRVDYESDDKISRTLWFSARVRKQDSKIDFAIAVMAWKDESGKRRHWHRKLEIRPTLPSPDELTILLDDMYKLLNSISDKDLTDVVL